MKKSDILQAIQAMAEAADAAACTKEFKQAVAPYGIVTFACGEVDLEDRAKAIFYALDWPDAWRDFYVAHLIEKDPLLRLLSVTRAPFLWSELFQPAVLKTEELYIIKLAEKKGWLDGFVLPVPRGGAHFGLVSLVSSRQLDPEQDKPDLLALSCYYLEKIRSLVVAGDFPIPPFGLSDRELECLALSAQGCGDRAVAASLSIKPATVHEYVERAKRRLNAKTRTQAVAMAIAFGVIRWVEPSVRFENKSLAPSE